MLEWSPRRNCREENILNNLQGLFILSLEAVENLSGVLHSSIGFFFPFGKGGPFVSCPWVLKIYFSGVFVPSGSYFISVSLGSPEGGSGGGGAVS